MVYSNHSILITCFWIYRYTLCEHDPCNFDSDCFPFAIVLQIESSKTRYEDLAVGIDTDITSLQERIRKLKFPKKQTEEL